MHLAKQRLGYANGNADTEEEAANGTRLNGVGVGASWGVREELVSHVGVLQEMEETV